MSDIESEYDEKFSLEKQKFKEESLNKVSSVLAGLDFYDMLDSYVN